MPLRSPLSDADLAHLTGPLHDGPLARAIAWHRPGLADDLELVLAELLIRRSATRHLPEAIARTLLSNPAPLRYGAGSVAATIRRAMQDRLVDAALAFRDAGRPGSAAARAGLGPSDDDPGSTAAPVADGTEPRDDSPIPTPDLRPMPSSDPLTILLEHHRWANEALLDACADLDHAALHRRFEMGRGSLHDTIMHVLGAMRGWGDMLAGRAQRPRLDAGDVTATVDEMRALNDELCEELEASAVMHPNEELVSAERGGKLWTFTRGAVLTHVLTHSMHHRAQALNLLRQLGRTDLPQSSVMEWVAATDDPDPAS